MKACLTSSDFTAFSSFALSAPLVWRSFRAPPQHVGTRLVKPALVQPMYSTLFLQAWAIRQLKMTKTGFMAAVIAAVFLVACSKTETQVDNAQSHPTPVQEIANPASQSPDYKLICERLIALAPEARKAGLSLNCVAEYQNMLPSCQNASAVNDCYANLKEWSGRLACLDSCVRK